MENQYNIEHAREILEPCHLPGNYLLTDERGVWPAIERDQLLLPETKGLRWRPARQLQHLPGAPEVKVTPTQQNDRSPSPWGFSFVWCWVATCWLHGAKPCTAGYMVAT